MGYSPCPDLSTFFVMQQVCKSINLRVNHEKLYFLKISLNSMFGFFYIQKISF